MTRNTLIFLVAAAMAALVVAGCGGGGNQATAASTQSGGGSKTINVTDNGDLGRILTDSKGRTIYLFEKDTNHRSACYGQCATYWPPLLTTAKPVAGTGVKKALLGTIRRSNGKKQVTYNGHPLSRYIQDPRPGQITGQDSHFFGAAWYVVSPSGKKIGD